MIFNYQPKGSMCRTCKNVSMDCSNLNFAIMPGISKPDNNNVVVVRCTKYKKAVVINQTIAD